MIILKETGVVRRLDELGRVVIPKEIRKNRNTRKKKKKKKKSKRRSI